MSFRIGKRTVQLAHGFRGALRGELADAIKELDLSSRSPRAARIHNARRRMKKVRSAFRLLEAASFPGVSRIDHDLLRDASAEVAASRGADANLGVLKKLCDDSGSDRLRFARIFAALEKEKLTVSHGTTAGMHKASTLLKGALSRIDAWDDGSIEWNKVLSGMEHLYKRARAACRKASDETTAENLHKWRKCAKDIYNGLKLAGDEDSKKIRRLSRHMKKLGTLLGADHDLAILREALDQHRIGKEKAVIEKLIAEHRRGVQDKALKLGAKYFSRKPAAFIECIEN